MRRPILWCAVVVLAACSNGDSVVVISVGADAPLSDVTTLHTVSTAAGKSVTHELSEAAPFAIPPAKTFAVEVPRSITGTFTLDVEARDADGQPLAAGSGSTTLSPGRRSDISIALGHGLANDLGSDMGPDAVDMIELPDLAVQLTAVPATKDFGSIDEGMTSATASFVIQNPGTPTGTLSVNVSGANAAAFHVESDACSGLALNSFDKCAVVVSYHASGAGAQMATLLVGDGTRSGQATLSGLSIGIIGDGCRLDTDCQSGHCVDGYCCNVATASCSGCMACNVAGSLGTCAPVPTGSDPHSACATVACSTHACDGAGHCGAGQAGTVCQSDGCKSGAIVAHVCTGTQSGCPSATQNQPCPGNFTCANSMVCNTSCATDNDCRSGWCNNGSCAPPVQPGAACSRARQCSGYCTGGLCRNCVLGSFCSSESACQSYCGVTPYSGSPICSPTADGTNTCSPGACSAYASPSSACAAAGVGNSCNSSGACQCTSNADCTTALAPYCLTYPGVGSFCGCQLLTAGSPQGVFSCAGTQTCVALNTCKSVSGAPCSSSSECASGNCNGAYCL